ncbi:hypothetical protein BY458DRAFT_523977 [Sporodiniella umbellata]|nr:hypothetical protein BY458DRAFT_523977 [Sporodiniella umbellata]
MGPKRPRGSHRTKILKTKRVNKQTETPAQETKETAVPTKDTQRSDVPSDKKVELEETTKLKKSSEQLVRHFELLGEKITLVTNEVSAASNTMHHWRYVFGTMAHKEGEPMVKFDLQRKEG